MNLIDVLEWFENQPENVRESIGNPETPEGFRRALNAMTPPRKKFFSQIFLVRADGSLIDRGIHMDSRKSADDNPRPQTLRERFSPAEEAILNARCEIWRAHKRGEKLTLSVVRL